MRYGLAFILCFSGCMSSEDIPIEQIMPEVTKETLIENIDQVIRHKPSWYTLIVESGDEPMKTYELSCNLPQEIRYSSRGDAFRKVYTNLPKDKKPWAIRRSHGRLWISFELHVHSVDDLKGGEYTRKIGNHRTETVVNEIWE